MDNVITRLGDILYQLANRIVKVENGKRHLQVSTSNSRRSGIYMGAGQLGPQGPRIGITEASLETHLDINYPRGISLSPM